MKINYNWKNVDHSKAAEKYANSKLDRVSNTFMRFSPLKSLLK